MYGDLELLAQLLANPTALADEFGLPCPPVATDDDPGDQRPAADDDPA